MYIVYICLFKNGVYFFYINLNFCVLFIRYLIDIIFCFFKFFLFGRFVFNLNFCFFNYFLNNISFVEYNVLFLILLFYFVENIS